MELTVDQALQQGVAAHKEGKLQLAERLYRAVLQSHPNHPDANHNLGVLAVSVGKPLDAAPLFKLALEANSQIEQFWLSYIDVLIRLERFDEARRVLVDGEKFGVSADKLDALNQRLQGSVPNHTNRVAKGQTLSGKRKRLSEKKKSKRRKTQGASSSAGPSQDQINRLIGHYQAGRFAEAEPLAVSLTQQFPRHPFGWKILGPLLIQTGRLTESLVPMQKSVELSPQDADAHSNLGNMLKSLGRLDEAEASHRQAIALKPDFAEAHNNLGNTLIELGRLDEAEASLRQAIALKPDFAEAHSNLGNALKELGRLDDAVSSFAYAINLKADYSYAYANLGNALKGLSANEANRSLYPVLINLLKKGNFVRPSDIAGAISSLLKQDNQIVELLPDTTTFIDIEAVGRAIAALSQLPLLHQLMRICPLPDLQLEVVFVSIRKVLLASLGQIKTSPELTYFLSTLSLHCFINEYVYFETEEEAELISGLETAIAESIARASQPTITKILCLAIYRPLHQYEWSKNLQVLDQLPEVKKRLIEEPGAERAIARDLPSLADVEDNVSRNVREQYEENPYPRWVTLAIPPKAKSVAEVCEAVKLRLRSENIKGVLYPSILIAGCGTGQHSIETACRFANCQVTAVDLSLASLAYAQRKTSELRITNIKYLQADILNLGDLGRKFDIIESSGVLHHMDDPMEGWRVLVNLLKTGGLMKIGLYSELARRDITRIREEIALTGIGTSEAEIRKFRQALAESRDEHHQLLTGVSDFFSLSTVRDSIFHVQEHHFTLPQIQSCLDELGLEMCGFESRDIVAKFKESVGEESDTCDLSLWHQFEGRHPHTFIGMYQFWCQKV
mgnify:CR=1 FL=1